MGAGMCSERLPWCLFPGQQQLAMDRRRFGWKDAQDQRRRHAGVLKGEC